MAQSLAQLRGHKRVWRMDVIDGVIGALVKEELAYGRPHPFLTAVLDLFRGEKRGRLAEGTTLPPLVLQVRELLAGFGWMAEVNPSMFSRGIIALVRYRSSSAALEGVWLSVS